MYFQEECFEAVSSIAGRINAEDADMRSHVVMSIFMVKMLMMMMCTQDDGVDDGDLMVKSMAIFTAMVILKVSKLTLANVCAMSYKC